MPLGDKPLYVGDHDQLLELAKDMLNTIRDLIEGRCWDPESDKDAEELMQLQFAYEERAADLGVDCA